MNDEATPMPSGPKGELVGKLLGGLACLAFAGAAYAVVFFAVAPALEGGYVDRLLRERGLFQHVNTFLFFLGIATVLRTMLACLREERGRSVAGEVAQTVVSKWRNRIEAVDTGSSMLTQQMQEKQDQGLDILRALREKGCADAGDPVPELTDSRMYVRRLYRIGCYLFNTRAQNLVELSDMNRDLSSLDEDALSGPFGNVRYIIYLMPVVGFLGTVYGIGQAMGAISRALPEVKNLEGFIDQLGGATAALQIAFDTTLLALLLSGVLTFLLTIATSMNGEMLRRLDTWVIENIISHITQNDPLERVIRRGFDDIIMGGGPDAAIEKAAEKISNDLRDSLADERKKFVTVVRKALDDIHDHVLEAMDRSREEVGRPVVSGVEGIDKRMDAFSHGMDMIAGQVSDAAEKLDAIRNAVASIDEQQKRSGEIVSAVGELPAAARDLGEAAKDLGAVGESLSGVAKVGESVDRGVSRLDDIASALGALDEMSAQAKAASEAAAAVRDDARRMAEGQEPLAEAVDAVRDALLRVETGEDGEAVRRDALTALDEMRGALGEMSAQNAKQLKRAMDDARHANDLITGEISGAVNNLNSNLSALVRAFNALSTEIKDLAGGMDE